MTLELEQLIYGSFPFWDRGYDLLARSPGCSPALTAEVLAVCRRFGQPPSAEASKSAMFAIRLPSGPWAVVGVGPQGADDRGRPGALAFHALIVPARDYARAGSNPFAFTHQSHWSSETPPTLARAQCSVEPTSPPLESLDPPKAGRIVKALGKRRRVALESTGPIDLLAREVWAGLPRQVRARASVATWAFSVENRFDLVALPRLAGVALDASYVPPSTLDAPDPPPRPELGRDLRAPGAALVGLLGLAVVGSLALAWSMTGGKPREPETVPIPLAVLPESPTFEPTEGARVRGRLSSLADRFEGFEVGPASDPARLLARVAEALHYHGRVLTEIELDQIARDPNPDKVRALAWHDQIQRFLDDQPLPGDFASMPLPRQLVAIARSFHLDPSVEAGSVPDALIATLARRGLIRPTPLAARFPALSDYVRFLGKLPRSDDPPESETHR